MPWGAMVQTVYCVVNTFGFAISPFLHFAGVDGQDVPDGGRAANPGFGEKPVVSPVIR